MPQKTAETRERAEATPRRRAGTPWWGKLLAALVALVVLFVLLIRFAVIPGLGELFGEDTHDRTGPALLKSIKDMSRYEAATGNFQVVVDLEKDTKFLPDALKGKRTLYVGAGSVSAYVELGGLKDKDVRVNDDRTEASLRLPHAVLGKPALDPDRSYAVSKQRGLLDRLGDFFSDNPNDERAVQKLAAQHIGDAAKDSELPARAEKNTTAMLEGLLHSLGFDTVHITYAAKK
ncbi:DUF4230 domain-containing protein [Streptomyces sp. CA-253872]|uniref:DUF4230 domain-containing protein n=1 Tax=Streptomyces sp. CA-253872 TaxID=3240067 RepID=UPI003D91D283